MSTENKPLIGKLAKFRVPLRNDKSEFVVNVTVVDQRQAFGRQDVKIAPVSGSGETWVSQEKVEL